MGITFKFPRTAFDADALKKLDLPKFVQQEGMNIRVRIISDTTRGVAANGGGLKPYSAPYKDQIDAGRVAGKAPGNHTPNVTATGTLLRSLQVKATPEGAEIVFEGTHPPARKVSKAGAKAKVSKAKKQYYGPGGASFGGHVKAARKAESGLVRGVRLAKAAGGRKKKREREAAFRAATGWKGKVSLPASGKAKGGGGGDVANAVIAQAQYKMGRTGWFEISKKDKEGIVSRLKERIGKALKIVVAQD